MNKNPVPTPAPTPAPAPAPAPTPAPVAPTATPVAPAAPKKKTGLIVGIIAAILLIGGGVVATIFFLAPKADATADFNKAIAKVIDGSENLKLTGTISAASLSGLNININSEFSGSKSFTEASLDMSELQSLLPLSEVSLKIAANDQDSYFKAEGLSPILSSFDIDLSELEDSWYHFNAFKYITDAFMLNMDSETSDTFECVINSDEIIKAYSDNSFFVLESYKGDEFTATIGDPYVAKIDINKLVDAANAATKTLQNSNCLNEYQEIEPATADDFEDLVNEAPLIYIEMKNGKPVRLYSVIGDSTSAITLDLKIEYPANVNFEFPTEFKELTDFLGDYSQMIPYDIEDYDDYDYDYDYDYDFDDLDDYDMGDLLDLL